MSSDKKTLSCNDIFNVLEFSECSKNVTLAIMGQNFSIVITQLEPIR